MDTNGPEMEHTLHDLHHQHTWGISIQTTINENKGGIRTSVDYYGDLIIQYLFVFMA